MGKGKGGNVQAMWILAAAWGVMSVIGFAAMGVDKRRARHQRRRISERCLWSLAWLLGAPGVLCGMWIFRHKTKKRRFAVGLPLLAALQGAALGVLMSHIAP